MTKEELSALLNGRAYGQEITKEEIQLAAKHDLVVVFGASDDLMELRGAIEDELGAWGGERFYVNSEGLLWDCDCNCKHYQVAKIISKELYAKWCEESPYSWTYKTSIPHSTFEIVDNDTPYCRGIVFSMNDL